MIDTLNWPTLETRRTKFRLMLYKIIHHVVAITPPDNLLVPVDRRSRLSSNHGFRHIQTSKDSYKFSFYPRTVIQWNSLPPHIHEAATVEVFKTLTPVAVIVPLIHL